MAMPLGDFEVLYKEPRSTPCHLLPSLPYLLDHGTATVILGYSQSGVSLMTIGTHMFHAECDVPSHEPMVPWTSAESISCPSSEILQCSLAHTISQLILSTFLRRYGRAAFFHVPVPKHILGSYTHKTVCRPL
jgi:hypothetical protein